MNSPLYIRWTPENLPYAIELRLDLISILVDEISASDQAGLGIGGILIGSMPNPTQQIVSIDEIAFIPRHPDAGREFSVGPAFQSQVIQIMEGVRRQGKQLIGFFRSDLRVQTPQPTENDRLVLSLQFRQPVSILLIVQAHTPHTAVLYVCNQGQIPERPSVKEFQLDENEFRALPEIYREPAPVQESADPRRANFQLYIGLSLATVLLIIFLGLVTGAFTNRKRLPGDQTGLNVVAAGRILAIRWDHSTRAVTSAQAGTLVISDGESLREIRLGADDLHLGTVDYEPVSSRVQVTLNLAESNLAPVRQSVRWNGSFSLP